MSRAEQCRVEGGTCSRTSRAGEDREEEEVTAAQDDTALGCFTGHYYYFFTPFQESEDAKKSNHADWRHNNSNKLP